MIVVQIRNGERCREAEKEIQWHGETWGVGAVVTASFGRVADQVVELAEKIS